MPRTIETSRSPLVRSPAEPVQRTPRKTTRRGSSPDGKSVTWHPSPDQARIAQRPERQVSSPMRPQPAAGDPRQSTFNQLLARIIVGARKQQRDDDLEKAFRDGLAPFLQPRGRRMMPQQDLAFVLNRLASAYPDLARSERSRANASGVPLFERLLGQLYTGLGASYLSVAERDQVLAFTAHGPAAMNQEHRQEGCLRMAAALYQGLGGAQMALRNVKPSMEGLARLAPPGGVAALRGYATQLQKTLREQCAEGLDHVRAKSAVKGLVAASAGVPPASLRALIMSMFGTLHALAPKHAACTQALADVLTQSRQLQDSPARLGFSVLGATDYVRDRPKASSLAALVDATAAVASACNGPELTSIGEAIVYSGLDISYWSDKKARDGGGRVDSESTHPARRVYNAFLKARQRVQPETLSRDDTGASAARSATAGLQPADTGQARESKHAPR